MKQLICLVLVLALIQTLAQPALASEVEYISNQERTLSDDNVEVPEAHSVITNLPEDLKIWGQETFRKENAPVLIGVTAITAIQVATDFEMWQAARVPLIEIDWVRKWSNMGVSMGDGFFQFGIVGGFLAGGKLTNNKRALRTAAQITESIFATGIVVQIIKHVTGRESPFSSEERNGVWRVFPDQIEYAKDFQKFDAVPSGHLSTAVTTFIVIQENYPEQKWIPYVGYPIVTWVAIGLVATSIHWVSDFPIAVALGYSFAKQITRRNKIADGKISQEDNKSWEPMLFPAASSRGEPMIVAGWEF